MFSNIPKYLELKSKNNSKTKFGINYIILKKYAEKVHDLINKIIEINKNLVLRKITLIF